MNNKPVVAHRPSSEENFSRPYRPLVNAERLKTAVPVATDNQAMGVTPAGFLRQHHKIHNASH